MSVDHFTYRVTWSAEDGEHVGLCAEFPSLSWLAKTPEAALKLLAGLAPAAARNAKAEAMKLQAMMKRIRLPPAAESPGRNAVPPAPTFDKYSPCQSFSLLLHLKQL